MYKYIIYILLIPIQHLRVLSCFAHSMFLIPFSGSEKSHSHYPPHITYLLKVNSLPIWPRWLTLLHAIHVTLPVENPFVQTLGHITVLTAMRPPPPSLLHILGCLYSQSRRKKGINKQMGRGGNQSQFSIICLNSWPFPSTPSFNMPYFHNCPIKEWLTGYICFCKFDFTIKNKNALEVIFTSVKFHNFHQTAKKDIVI